MRFTDICVLLQRYIRYILCPFIPSMVVSKVIEKYQPSINYMKLKQLLVVVLLSIAAMASAQMPKIPVDPNVKIGHLDNGLTYYIRQNNWPEHVANFYIAQRVGSIQENEDQRGLAHFLEHMAFNGSEHFPDSTLLDYTRSIGVEFGSDLNAYTGIDQTVYRICNVPTQRESALDSCLLILKDWSNGLTLDDKEIDQERGVIHQEWQMRSSGSMRIFERLLPKLYPGSKYGERLPIGLMSVVDNFKYKELRDYYHKWYRPDNQAIIVVGDIDPAKVEAQIKELWKDAVTPANAAKVVDEPVPDNDKAIYLFDKDKEMPYNLVSVAMKHDVTTNEEKESFEYLLSNYFKNIVAMMLNQRLSDAAQKADCPFIQASSSDGQFIYSKTKDAFSLDAVAKEGKICETLEAVYREAQRARQYGFTAGEYDRMKSEYLSQLESAYTNRNKIKNDQYGDEYRDHFLDNEPIPGIEVEYQVMKQLVSMPDLSVDVINEGLQELISDNDTNLVVYVMGQEKDGATYPSEADLASCIAKVRGEKLEAYVDNVKNEPLVDVTQLPKKGKIVKETENKTLGYKELTLSNGARVILKKTDYKDNQVLFQAMAKGGKGLYGDKDNVNLKLFDDVIGASGLGEFSNNELSKALLGKQANVACQLSSYYQSLGGSCVPKDIETLLQLVYLNFKSVKKDMDSYNSLMQQYEVQLKSKGLSPESAFGDSVSTTLYGHSPRTAPLELSDLSKVNYDRILQIQKERFANAGQFVYYFIGNFDEATLRPLIEQYIGCLPKGKAEKWKDAPEFAKGTVVNNFKRKMETPKAIALDVYHQPMAYNVDNAVLVDAAAQVLTMVYLKTIREDASAAYSVGAGGSLQRRGDKAIALIQDYCPMDPNKCDQAIGLLESGMKENTVSVDADKVEKIKTTMLKNLDEQLKTNGFWLDNIDEYVWTGVDLVSGYRNAVQSLTPAKIAAFLKGLVSTNNHIQVVMLPEK